MSKHILVLALFSLLLSCEETHSLSTQEGKEVKTYKSNSPSIPAFNSLTLTKEGEVVHAERGYISRTQTHERDNMIYFHDHVNTRVLDNGDILIEGDGDDLWFIPFMISADPVKVDPGGICILYKCACGGFPSQNTTGCQTTSTANEIGCARNGTGCESDCIGFAFEVPCLRPDVIDMSRVTTGGVFVRAQSVQVTQPEEFNTPNTDVKFFKKDDGTIILYEDAGREGYIKSAK